MNEEIMNQTVETLSEVSEPVVEATKETAKISGRKVAGFAVGAALLTAVTFGAYKLVKKIRARKAQEKAAAEVELAKAEKEAPSEEAAVDSKENA